MNMGFKTPGIDGILWTPQIILGILVYAAVGVPCGKSVPALGAAYLAATGFFCRRPFSEPPRGAGDPQKRRRKSRR
jgi:hypothetical protein